MKLYIFLAMSLLIVSCTGGQKAAKSDDSHKAEIKTAITNYFGLLTAEKWSEALDYMHPAIFEMAPKESLIKMFEETLNNPNMVISFGDKPNITNISKKVVEDNMEYAVVDYINAMTVQLKGENVKEMVPFMQAAFEQSDGKDNVTFEESTNTFTINKKSQMIVLKEVGSEDWKLLENKKEQKVLFDKMIPKTVSEKLGL